MLLASGLIMVPIGQGLIALGIPGPPESSSGMEYFQEFSLAQIFVMLFGGAGMFEEVVFRLFVVSGLWYLFKRPSWAIIISALIFGLYHLTPLN